MLKLVPAATVEDVRNRVRIRPDLEASLIQFRCQAGSTQNVIKGKRKRHTRVLVGVTDVLERNRLRVLTNSFKNDSRNSKTNIPTKQSVCGCRRRRSSGRVCICCVSNVGLARRTIRTELILFSNDERSRATMMLRGRAVVSYLLASMGFFSDRCYELFGLGNTHRAGETGEIYKKRKEMGWFVGPFCGQFFCIGGFAARIPLRV